MINLKIAYKKYCIGEKRKCTIFSKLWDHFNMILNKIEFFLYLLIFSELKQTKYLIIYIANFKLT